LCIFVIIDNHYKTHVVATALLEDETQKTSQTLLLRDIKEGHLNDLNQNHKKIRKPLSDSININIDEQKICEGGENSNIKCRKCGKCRQFGHYASTCID